MSDIGEILLLLYSQTLRRVTLHTSQGWKSTILDKNSGKNRFVTQNNTFVYFLRNFGPHPPVSKLFLVMELEIDIPTLIMGARGRIR